MSLIKGQFWGDSSGKVAGAVFSRGKGGKSVRARVKPTDANTQAQQSIRAGFSNSISLWASLSSAAKRAWNSFAVSGFRSKNAKKGNTPSGFQAFASSNFALRISSSHLGVTTFSPTTITAPITDLPSFLVDAPVVGFSACIQTSTGDPLFLSVKSVAFLSTGALITLTLGINPAPQASAPKFENPVTNEPISLSVYCSAPIAPGRQNSGKPDAYLLANTGLIGALTGWTSGSDIVLKIECSQSYLESLKIGFAAGNDIFMVVYAVSQAGQMSRIGMVKTTIT